MRDDSANPPPTDTQATPADTSIADAAQTLLRERFRAVHKHANAIASADDDAVRATHKLRVATRRADAAVRAFGPSISLKRAKAARRALRRIRRAASRARAQDVFAADLTRLLSRLSPEEALAAGRLIGLASARAERARLTLRRRLRAGELRAVRRAARRLLKRAKNSDSRTPFAQLARTSLHASADHFQSRLSADLLDADHLHSLRLAAKRLRYTIESFRPAFPSDAANDAIEAVSDLQESLGAANDSREALAHVKAALERWSTDQDAALREGLHALARRFDSQQQDRHAAALERAAELAPTIQSRVARLLADHVAAPPRPIPQTSTSRTSPLNGAHRVQPRHSASDLAADAPAEQTWRVAAIDVGTNTIRLIIAEAFSADNYRILDDEKETSRLGRGLAATGALAPEAIDAAATTIAHMRRIAEGYGAARIRVIATAAVREATNRAEFLSLVRQRAGLPVDVISAEQEARLAFVSASRAFDIRALPAAVADVGGGSTEVVLSAQGVIEEIATIPMGAVRLTEQFGGPEPAAGERHDEMREHIRATLRERLPRSAHDLQMLIGSGGTFEAIAKIAMCEERGVAYVPAGARGYDLRRDDVKRILSRLRRMTDAERRAVPGLSSQRADIIVAGAAIVLEVLKRLRVDRLRVNDGGIRDGIIRSMIEEHFAPTRAEPADRARARAVRDFAAGCRYDRRHCAHVAGLALQLFDQLAAHPATPLGPWRSEEARSLLETAAILHDCGYHINYARHHLHSHHLIIHSDMPGFSRRELDVVAAIARYHRASPPKPKHDAFSVLAREDRELVLALSAVLRITDGLDRTHTQRVHAVRLEHTPEHDEPWIIHVEAESDPVVDIWGAERKSDVFHSFFGSTPRIVWSCDAASASRARTHPAPHTA